ncbi:hypothetical protein MOTHE_c06190 [Moorella thermoacetica]|uniref:WYL domain-containing protein n=2 Tax=Neomoorella thermoacetica TaxID=1525 RepID=Q2RKN8_MOOTA|nr:hypothetical protein MOTHE_c06190 [Moorella thermoacetica]AKX96072.1 hypothetical protein MOTHA_c07150 [Moorella thermoacetica]OIQ55284.1 hypothetical protein MOCA_18560 [Moorella thermoacetica]QCZ99882.1 hypothetical protein MothHH_00729 [Moorella thermoacetica]TYL07464.1 hypothetical protein MOOCA_22290 [Moorella thermoacetica]
MAIYRKCKYCGRPISLREMPAGQWVAFDVGTDNVHHCGSRPTITPPAVSAVAATLDTGTVTASPVVATSSEQIRALLKKALQEHRCVHLNYYTASRKALTDRVVEPLALEPGDWGGTILRAYCRWRQDIRSFALSNIRRAELLEETFSPRSLPQSQPITIYRTSISGRASIQASSKTPSTASESTGCIWWLIVVGVVLLWLLFGSR